MVNIITQYCTEQQDDFMTVYSRNLLIKNVRIINILQLLY